MPIETVLSTYYQTGTKLNNMGGNKNIRKKRCRDYDYRSQTFCVDCFINAYNMY